MAEGQNEKQFVGLSVPSCPRELHERLWIESGYQRTTLAQVILTALEDYLTRQEATRITNRYPHSTPA